MWPALDPSRAPAVAAAAAAPGCRRRLPPQAANRRPPPHLDLRDGRLGRLLLLKLLGVEAQLGRKEGRRGGEWEGERAGARGTERGTTALPRLRWVQGGQQRPRSAAAARAANTPLCLAAMPRPPKPIPKRPPPTHTHLGALLDDLLLEDLLLALAQPRRQHRLARLGLAKRVLVCGEWGWGVRVCRCGPGPEAAGRRGKWTKRGATTAAAPRSGPEAGARSLQPGPLLPVCTRRRPGAAHGGCRDLQAASCH